MHTVGGICVRPYDDFSDACSLQEDRLHLNMRNISIISSTVVGKGGFLYASESEVLMHAITTLLTGSHTEGGCLLLLNCSVVVSNCTLGVSISERGNGGLISISNGYLSIINSMISDASTAIGNGGALYVGGGGNSLLCSYMCFIIYYPQR